jgi:hypothetical protein
MDIAAKCMALLLSRMYVQDARPGTVMAAWLHNMALNGSPPNPPKATAYPTGMVHVRAYALDMPYIPPPRLDDTPKLWRKRIYWVLHTMAAAQSSARPLRIMTMYPNYDWSRIWRNLHTAWIPDIVRSTWYMVIHDILPTKERLNRIAISDSDCCNYCGQTDTLYHRIMECGALTPAKFRMIGPSCLSSTYGPVRYMVLLYGFWPSYTFVYSTPTSPTC